MNALATFDACPRLRQVDLDWFRQQGVSPFALLGYGAAPTRTGIADHLRVWGDRPPPWCPGFTVKRARVQFLRGGTFAFEGERRAEADRLEPAFVLPAIEDGVVIDFIAWHPRSGRLACLHRSGWSGLLMGPDGLDADDVLDIHPDPLSWLRACRKGVVVVREALARTILLEQPSLRATDPDHGQALKAMLERVALPRIVVPIFSAERIAA